MKTLHSSRGSLTLVAGLGYAVLAVAATVVALLVTPKPTQEKIIAKFTHKPAEQVDVAKAADAKQASDVQAKKDETVHAAALEADKASKAAAELPPSVPADIVKRFTGNANGLLHQVSPLTAQEDQTNTAILLGMLAEEHAKRVAAESGLQVSQADLAVAAKAKADAEAKQTAAEASLASTGRDLTAAQAAKKATEQQLGAKEDALRVAFDKENAMANELRATILHRWALGVGLLIALVAWLWIKWEMRNVGFSLHNLEASVTPAAFHDFVTQMDDKVGPLGQYLIREGKAAGAAAEARAGSLVSGAMTSLAAKITQPPAAGS